MPQVPVEDVVGVRCDYAGVASLVQQPHHLAGRVTCPTRLARSDHGPHLRHHRRCHQAAVDRRPGECRICVDGIGVADRLEPVQDDRQVHRIPGEPAAALAERHDPLGGGPDPGGAVLAHVSGHKRGTLGSFSPAVAISSRCTSFTPPPKVSTRLRLCWVSSHASRSAVDSSAGSPYLPPTSSTSCPSRCIRSEEKTFVAEASAMSTLSATATCQLSNSLTRRLAANSASARRTSGSSATTRPPRPRVVSAQARSRSYSAPSRPAGPSITRSWLSC